VRALSDRWFVFVPAGVVVVDPLSILDPVLMPREQVAAIAAGDPAPGAGALDLRLGPARGTVTIRLHEPATLAPRRGRTAAEVATANVVRIAVVDRAHLLARARERRIPVSS